MNPQILHALRRHAILSVSIERAQAMGHRVPREAAMEVQRIEADLATVLPADPALQRNIAAFQAQVKSDLLRMESQDYGQAHATQQQEARARIDAGRDRVSKAVTSGVNDGNDKGGLTLAQMQTALRVGAFVTQPPIHAREAYEAEVYFESGGKIDPKQFQKAWSHAFDNPGPAREKFLDRIGADKMDRADRQRFWNDLSTEMFQTEMSARRDDRLLETDKEAFEPRVHQVSAPDARRLDVTSAMLKHAGTREGVGIIAGLGDRVSDASLNDTSGTGMRSDVAKAVADHSGQKDFDTGFAETIDDFEAATSETLL